MLDRAVCGIGQVRETGVRRTGACSGSGHARIGAMCWVRLCRGNEGAAGTLTWLSLTGHGSHLAVVQAVMDEEDGSP